MQNYLSKKTVEYNDTVQKSFSDRIRKCFNLAPLFLQTEEDAPSEALDLVNLDFYSFW